MAIVTVFAASFCHGEEVAEKVAQELGYARVGDEFLEETARRYKVSREKLDRIMYGRFGFLEIVHRERRRHIPFIAAGFAEQVARDHVVYAGYAGHLLPREVSHVLKVCVVGNYDYRVERARKTRGVDEKQAKRLIQETEKECAQWTQHLWSSEPWDERLYDIVVPIHDRAVGDAVKLICENTRQEAVATTVKSKKAFEDFLLAAQVKAALTRAGEEDVDVSGRDGEIAVTINRFAFWLSHLQKKLQDLAGEIPGVRHVDIRLGPGFHASSRYDLSDVEPPPNVMLVDDERDFVEALSQRLEARRMAPTLAYNGREALEKLEKEAPDVMILDLRMPEIDGMDVLRKVKSERPQTEVIILTGHGGEKEEELARELGAFAYLQKPVDIELLTRTMKEAYRKARQEKPEDLSGASDEAVV